MVSYFVMYQGVPHDADAFAGYYARVHASILARFPRIRAVIMHRPVGWTDPFPVNRGDVALLVQMTFDSEADLNAALASTARADARDDFANFPAFDGRVTHQAFTATELA